MMNLFGNPLSIFGENEQQSCLLDDLFGVGFLGSGQDQQVLAGMPEVITNDGDEDILQESDSETAEDDDVPEMEEEGDE